MRIEPSGTYTPSTIGKTGATQGKTARPAESATGSTAEVSTFAPTADLTRLLASVRAQPEVRPEVVQDVAQRLAAGEFNSSAAAAETAQALADDLLASGD